MTEDFRRYPKIADHYPGRSEDVSTVNQQLYVVAKYDIKRYVIDIITVKTCRYFYTCKITAFARAGNPCKIQKQQPSILS